MPEQLIAVLSETGPSRLYTRAPGHVADIQTPARGTNMINSNSHSASNTRVRTIPSSAPNTQYFGF